MISCGDTVRLALLGGLLALDRTAFLQTMASRPLVASSLAGYALGNPALGLLCGCLLELVWLLDLPVGASIPPDETLAALLAVAFGAASSPTWNVPARAALGVCAALPFSYVGRWVDMSVRRWNARLWEKAQRDAALGRGPGTPHLTGAVVFFGAGVLTTAGTAWVGSWGLAVLAPAVSPRSVVALTIAAAGIPIAGVAAMLAALPGRRFRILFGAGFVGGLALTTLRPLRAAARVLWRP